MKRPESDECCARSPSDKELALAETDYDFEEKAVLEVARFFWQSFAVPETQSWLLALQCAEDNFDHLGASNTGLLVLASVQSMRMSRVSCFQFNNPMCKGCASIVSEHERQFMNVFRAVREGSKGRALTHAMILCEGNDTELFISRMEELAIAISRANRLRKPIPVGVHAN